MLCPLRQAARAQKENNVGIIPIIIDIGMPKCHPKITDKKYF
jgi:hypothetical protein